MIRRVGSIGHREDALTWATVGATALSIAFSVVFIARSSFVYQGQRWWSLFDDAMISLRYARNLALGNGLVWNPGGPHVEGFTNPLWTLGMAVVQCFHGPDRLVSLWVMIAGLVLLAVNVLLVGRIARRCANGLFGPTVAMVLVALAYPLIFWTLRGMETGLVALEISAALLLALRLADRPSTGQTLLLSALFGATVLTRLDAILPCVCIGLFVLATTDERSRWGTFWKLSGIVGAVLVGQELFRLAYFGHWLPNTYALKISGAALGTRLVRGGISVFNAISTTWLLPLALAAWVGWRRRAQPAIRLLAAVVLCQLCYAIWAGGDAWEASNFADRYLTEALAPLCVLVALALEEAREDRRAMVRMLLLLGELLVVDAILRLRNWIPLPGLPESASWLMSNPSAPLALLVALVACGLLCVVLARRAGAKKELSAGVACALVLVAMNGQAMTSWVVTGGYNVEEDAQSARSGLELRAATDLHATLAVVWAGAIPYFARRDAIDLLGKVDAHIAQERPRLGFFYPGHTKWDYRYSVGKLHPDLITDLWLASPSELSFIRAEGYERLGPGIFVRPDDPLIEREALKKWCADLRPQAFCGNPRASDSNTRP